MATVPKPDKTLHFDIHASIVFQLGEDLITDVVQAVIELVKNSYDADATFVNILVESQKLNDVAGTFFPNSKGFIVVDDNGVGMDIATIKRGWLTISNSIKRELKRNNLTTSEKKRTPLGDKGLGRLGVQKLGVNVEIFTKPKNEDKEYHVGWSWNSFQGESTLTEIHPLFETVKPSRKRGTKLVISAIKDAEHWLLDDSVSDFEQKLSELISPYRTFSDFIIGGSVDGHPLELADITERVRRLAQLRYKLQFDGKTFSIAGRASLDFVRPKSGDEAISSFHRLVELDEGEDFFAFLSKLPFAETIKLRKGKSAAWFVEFSQLSDFAQMPGLRLISAGDPKDPLRQVAANPGPFHSEIDGFDLGRTAATQNIFNSAADYKKYIKHLNGVRIFRDGFGVRVDRDWLGLAKQWTTASSYYSLKPENTMGFVALTAEANSCLVETTDREGFKKTPHFDNFLALFAEFVKFAHDAQEFLRRGWLAYVKENERLAANVEPMDSPEHLYERLEKGLAPSSELGASLLDAVDSLKEAHAGVAKAVERATSGDAKSHESKELKRLVASLQDKVAEAQGVFVQVGRYLGEAEELRRISHVLREESLTVRDHLDEIYEVASLGVTAEALSHEINEIADKIARKTQEISKHLDRSAVTDSKVLGYVELIRVSVAALRKQMAHLAPSMKYVREQRERIVVNEFLDDLREFYSSRWEGETLKIEVRERKGPLVLSINRGKLTQVFDNLILNSEYWLREEIRTGRIKAGVITIEVSSPFVRISDNGPGIDPLVETTLFDPFVSKKPKRKGRGLGLFIVKQLLDTEGCTIALSPRRNDDGRLYRFDLDFTGALDGE